MSKPEIGSRVRFTLATSAGPRIYEAAVIGYRRNGKAPGSLGWIETRDDSGAVRSVGPNRCEVIQ